MEKMEIKYRVWHNKAIIDELPDYLNGVRGKWRLMGKTRAFTPTTGKVYPIEWVEALVYEERKDWLEKNAVERLLKGEGQEQAVTLWDPDAPTKPE